MFANVLESVLKATVDSGRTRQIATGLNHK